MVPIYHPEVRPSQAVLDADAEILARCGAYHVNALYFASQTDAAIVRRLTAERIVREQERLEKLYCAFCNERIGGQVAVIIAMRPVHPACAAKFEAWIAGDPSENDKRWSTVTEDTPVTWDDGSVCRWGDLMLADRKVVDFTPDGRLVGGYPF